MARFNVDVKVFINIEVEAETEDEARETAEAWVEWVEPTQEQLDDYRSDHGDCGVLTPGCFGVDGTSEVELIDDDEPPLDTPSLDTSFHDHEMDV